MTVPKSSTLAKNRQAGFEYSILDTLEAGIVLTGPEVKSVVSGHANLKGAYIAFEKDRPYLKKCHISPYANATAQQKGYEPEQNRSLLLHQKEIDTLQHQIKTEGITLIPLELYMKKGKIKLKMAIAKGKKTPRQTLRPQRKSHQPRN
jgi:SsrA-binding protein